MLQIALLGGLSLAWDDQPLPPITSARARALLGYLVLNRDHLQSRTALASLLWPDLPESQARRRLRQALWHVARRVDDLPSSPYLLREGDLVGFNADLPHQVDVDMFDHLSQGEDIAAMAQAVRLYRGPLLPGIYDDWVLLEQERLRERWLTLLDRLTRAYHEAGEVEAAAETARMLLQADPWHEPTARLLMDLLAHQGRTGEALQVYLDLRGRLQADLGVAPTPETTAIYSQFRATRAQVPPPTLPPRTRLQSLVREHEMTVLESALQSARGGHGQLVLLNGPAGIGKTHLAQTATEEAYRGGFWTLHAHAVEPFGPPALYSPLDQALRAALETLGDHPLGLSPLAQTALSGLLPDLVAAAPSLDATHMAPAHFHAALASALAGLAAGGPLLLVLDDMHWADPAVWAVLQALLPRLAGCPLAVIAALRSEDLPAEIAPWPTRLATHSAVRSLTLPHLSVKEVGRLTGQMLGQALPPALAARIHRETGGNPLFVVETVRGLMEEGDFRPGPDGQMTWPSEEALPIPATLQQALATRLSHLDSPTHRLLCQAAILGDGFDFDLLGALSGEEDEELLLEQLEELLGRNLLAEEDERYRFAHNLVRRVLYDGIHPRRRRLYHRRAAQALAHLAPQELAARARHAHAAQEWDEALPLALAAADQALSLFAIEEAEAFYHLAQEAEEHLPEVDTAVRLRRLRGLARAYQVRSEDETGTKVLEEWRSAASSLGDDAEEAIALAALATNLCRRGASADALPAAERAVGLAREDPRALATALNALGMCHEAQGDLLASLQLYRQAVEAACKAHAPQQQAESLNSLAIALEMVGEIEEAAEAYRRAASLATACGDRLIKSRALNNLATLHVLRGDYGPARKAYESTLAGVKALDIGEGQALVQGNLADVWLMMGYLDTAREYLEAALELVAQFNWPVEHARALLNLAGWAVARGQPQQALEFAQQAQRILPRQELQEEHLYYHYQLGRIYLALGDTPSAADHAARLTQLVNQTGMGWLEGQVATLEGRVRTAQGDLAAAEDALRRAVDTCEASGFRADCANARAELGVVLLHAGREDEAAQVLATAWEELARRMLRLDLAHLLDRLGQPPALPGQQEVSLPRMDAPLRRHPTAEECITILWTPDAGPLEPPLRRQHLRRARLRRLLTEVAVQGAAPTIKDLAQALGVSTATLNTDLSALREDGWPAFTRGYRQGSN